MQKKNIVGLDLNLAEAAAMTVLINVAPLLGGAVESRTGGEGPEGEERADLVVRREEEVVRPGGRQDPAAQKRPCRCQHCRPGD